MKKVITGVILSCFVIAVIVSLVEAIDDQKKIEEYMEVRIEEEREYVERKWPNMSEADKEKEVQNRAEKVRDLYGFHFSNRFIHHFGIYGLGVVIIVLFLLGMRVRISGRRTFWWR